MRRMAAVAGSTGVGEAFTAASVAACEAAGLVDFTMTAFPGVVFITVGLANFIEGSAAFAEAALEARSLPAHISMIGTATPTRIMVAAMSIRRPDTGITAKIRLATTRMSPSATRLGSRFLPADERVVVLPSP